MSCQFQTKFPYFFTDTYSIMLVFILDHFYASAEASFTKLKCELIGAEVRGLFIRLALFSRPALYCNNILSARLVYL